MNDPTIVLDLIDAFRRSKAMFTAVAYGIFDRTPATLDELAATLGLVPGALERLLDTCAALGLLERRGAQYANTQTADTYLRRDSAETMIGYILYSDKVLYHLWSHLDDALREGTPRWAQTFGMEAPIFDHFFRTEEAMRDFLLGMHGFGRLSSPAVIAAFDLTRYTRFVDLGGATGHFALAAAERFPQLHATVFDLPRVVEFGRRLNPDPRLEWVAGDFFADPLPPGDIYAVCRILHDWTEDTIHRLLAKVHAALPAGGALLIAEKLLEDDHSGPLPAHLQSLNMLVCTEGKERSAAQYRALLEAAGFRSVEARRTGAPHDAVLAVK